MSAQHLEATGFVQLANRSAGYYRTLRVIKVTQERPDRLEPGAIIVKVRFRIPAAAFEPLEPTATIEVPADLIQHEIAAEATK
ncbi:hypothetical protein [Psychromicrobium lacuslunae]|uniref:Uncharacterized protein n=1 Tax=Psychromicrobium lacuslunae TaxID=1618207 RepID=A0A0D4C1C9_9MICC|nr:hypothetical protein [Psychromicrobium lacuslunae]AJT42398.1 hypothetical protein UM93_14475 [Psychromicrobium lacuslunae]